MSETPGAHLEEEPQEERGAPGSRDTGSDEPAGGPAARPEGTSSDDSDTSVDAQGPIQEEMPVWPAGDQGG
jgi:hypothetical protein